jgi:archaellum component FlaC
VFKTPKITGKLPFGARVSIEVDAMNPLTGVRQWINSNVGVLTVLLMFTGLMVTVVGGFIGTIWYLGTTLATRADVDAAVDNAVSTLEESVTRLSSTVETLNGTVNRVNGTVIAQGETVDLMSRTVSALSETVGRVDGTVIGLQETVASTNVAVEHVNGIVDDLGRDVETVGDVIPLLVSCVIELDSRRRGLAYGGVYVPDGPALSLQLQELSQGNRNDIPESCEQARIRARPQ